MPNRAFIVAAARTLIAPKGGLHRKRELHELAAPALQHAWSVVSRVRGQRRASQRSHQPFLPDLVVLGNALGAGGNVARLCSLAVFPQSVPAVTLDTQCCSGMDAIAMAARAVASGDARVILAGGVESFSRAPQRFRLTDAGLQPYAQARFTPWADRDPDVIQAAQAFAEQHRIHRIVQEQFAIESHRKALHTAFITGLTDPYTRRLDSRLCRRFAPLIADSEYAITSATVAPQADAAAVVAVVNETIAQQFPWAIEIVHAVQVGCDPQSPALGGVAAGKQLLSEMAPKDRRNLRCIEVMESFAAQAIHTCNALELNSDQVNRRGGMLAMGHPIGASGAVLIGNLFLELQPQPVGSTGFAVIPAAGGQGSALSLRRSGRI